jgi:hypothetical protein
VLYGDVTVIPAVISVLLSVVKRTIAIKAVTNTLNTEKQIVSTLLSNDPRYPKGRLLCLEILTLRQLVLLIRSVLN